MVGRSASGLGFGAIETERPQIQFLDKGLNCPDRIVFEDVIIQAFGKTGCSGIDPHLRQIASSMFLACQWREPINCLMPLLE
jgi:hypothetical protein